MSSYLPLNLQNVLASSFVTCRGVSSLESGAKTVVLDLRLTPVNLLRWLVRKKNDSGLNIVCRWTFCPPHIPTCPLLPPQAWLRHQHDSMGRCLLNISRPLYGAHFWSQPSAALWPQAHWSMFSNYDWVLKARCNVSGAQMGATGSEKKKPKTYHLQGPRW